MTSYHNSSLLSFDLGSMRANTVLLGTWVMFLECTVNGLFAEIKNNFIIVMNEQQSCWNDLSKRSFNIIKQCSQHFSRSFYKAFYIYLLFIIPQINQLPSLLVGHLLSNHWLEFSVIDHPPLPSLWCCRVILQSAFHAQESASTEETKEMCVERREQKNDLWIMTTVLKSRHKAAEEIWAFRNHLICLLWCRFPASRAWMRSGVFWGAKQDVNMEI